MVSKMVLPAALAAAMMAGSAEAQVSGGFGQPVTGGFAQQPVTGGFAQPVVPGGFAQPTTNFNALNSGITPQFQPIFPNNNFGFTGPFADPRFGFNAGFNQFTPAFGGGFVNPNFVQFVPSFGGYGGYPGWGYSGPLIDVRSAWTQNPPVFPGYRGIPIAGINSPPLQPGARATRIVNSGSGSGYDYQSLARADALARTGNPAAVTGGADPDSSFGGETQGVTTGSPRIVTGRITNQAPGIEENYGPNGLGPNSGVIETRTAQRNGNGQTRTARTQATPPTFNGYPAVNVANVDPQQVRLVNRIEDVMEDRPLTEGTVVGMGTDGVSVRYERDGEILVQTFPAGQVFFFPSGGELATANTAPGMLRAGDQVLIPLPASDTIIRQSVAGTRQEVGGDQEVGGEVEEAPVRVRRASPARRPAK